MVSSVKPRFSPVISIRHSSLSHQKGLISVHTRRMFSLIISITHSSLSHQKGLIFQHTRRTFSLIISIRHSYLSPHKGLIVQPTRRMFSLIISIRHSSLLHQKCLISRHTRRVFYHVITKWHCLLQHKMTWAPIIQHELVSCDIKMTCLSKNVVSNIFLLNNWTTYLAILSHMVNLCARCDCCIPIAECIMIFRHIRDSLYQAVPFILYPLKGRKCHTVIHYILWLH